MARPPGSGQYQQLGLSTLRAAWHDLRAQRRRRGQPLGPTFAQYVRETRRGRRRFGSGS